MQPEGVELRLVVSIQPIAEPVNCAPYKVEFSNPDPSAVSFLWDFGDGTTSTLAEPSHVYLDSGSFHVTLITINNLGVVDTIVDPGVYIVVKPITDFIITTTNTCNGVIVNVNTTSPANTYSWNFGSGVTFSTPGATHTYPNVSASYLISLNSIDTNHCSAFVAKSFAVNTNNPIISNKRRACVGDTIIFDAGNMNYAAFNWNFGDGFYSTTKNPMHVYLDSGLYQVALTVTDINGCTQIFNMAYQIQVFDPRAAFNFNPPITNCVNLIIQFNNQSLSSNSWLWNFGDGSNSTLENPSKTFTLPGYYNITLSAFNNICSNSYTYTHAVYVSRPVADFTFLQTASCLPQSITFQDLSVDAVRWHWDFGDGDTSAFQNPVHTYSMNPTGPVTLTIYDVNGCQKIISKPNINVTQAAFSFSVLNNCNPVQISFSDSSVNAVSWHWDFGDGTYSSLANPIHVYTVNGIYPVELVVQSVDGCYDTLHVDSMVTVSTATAQFTADSLAGCLPLVVTFTDGSLNTVKWNWDFGDGSNSSNQNPSHIYSTPGIYTVQLISQNVFGCTDTLVKPTYITVRGSVPDFIISSTNGCAPTNIIFTDQSQGAVGWEWHFGDGTTDSVPNPSHTYLNQGTYTVSLYTMDSTGCSTIFSLPTPVIIGNAPTLVAATSDTAGCAPYTVTLNNSGTIADSIVWLMGDGTVLSGNNPSYIYLTAGTYYITMIAMNNGGCVDSLQLSYPVVVKDKPQVSFSSDITSGCSPVTINFIDQTENLQNAIFHWDFGNGDTSNVENPVYTYTAQGNFSVTLYVVDEGGCSDQVTINNMISVYDQLPPPPTVMHRVSVTDTMNVMLSWMISSANDVNYYNIYRLNPSTGNYDSIATLYQSSTWINNSDPEYRDYSANPVANSYSYKVQAVDFCGNTQPLDAIRAHGTMNVSSIASFRKVDVSWSPYIGCSISSYEIYRQDNLAGPFQLIGIVDTLTTAFADTSAWCPMPYVYRIRATDICNDNRFDSWSDTTIAQPSSDIRQQFC